MTDRSRSRLVHSYEGWAGEQVMGVLNVYPRGDPRSGDPAEMWTWGGDHWNHYAINERATAARMLRLWRRMGFGIRVDRDG